MVGANVLCSIVQMIIHLWILWTIADDSGPLLFGECLDDCPHKSSEITLITIGPYTILWEGP